MVTPRELGRQKNKNDEAQRYRSYSWEDRRRRMVNPRDIAAKAEEEGDPLESVVQCFLSPCG